MRKNKAVKTFAKKILKAYFTTKNIAKAVTVSKRIYDLVPKYETFEGVDGNKLIAARMAFINQKIQ